MIGEALKARIAALSPENRAKARKSVEGQFAEATAAFKRHEIGERALLAIGLAVNEVLADFPDALPMVAKINERHMRARLAELDASAS